MIRPFPNGKTKHVTVSMHSYKQAHGAHGVFGEFNEVAKKRRMSNKNVVKF